MFQVYNPDNFQRDQGVTENVKYEKKNIELDKKYKNGYFWSLSALPKKY